MFVIITIVSAAMRRFGFPMGDIVGAANRVADGDFSARVSEYGPPSLRTVARAFNSMTSRLEAQERQRRHLMADIAHELRTPLAVIQGRLEGLIDGVYPRDESQLTAVLHDTRMLARLVEDLRTLAHAESGMLALHKEPTDVGVLVQEVVNTFSAESAAKHVSIETHGAKDLPLIDVDPLRIREVLTNLVSNALHHTPEGGSVSLAVSTRSKAVIVEVTDSGTGIAADELPKIFDRFYKGHGSHGSGLGLTISKNLVEAHGGEIRAESQPGRGTTITFTLPTVEVRLKADPTYCHYALRTSSCLQSGVRLQPDLFFPINRQNCSSLSSVMRCPFARRRLISISFNPASRPAACSGLGLPLTTTVVRTDGMPWMIAPARRAALTASLRRLVRMPVNARWTPFSVRSTPLRNDAGGVCSASIISSALS